MKNPWLKKNPLMSMWLSGANKVAGAARGRASAETKRQVAGMISKGSRQLTSLGTSWLSASSARKKKGR